MYSVYGDVRLQRSCECVVICQCKWNFDRTCMSIVVGNLIDELYVCVIHVYSEVVWMGLCDDLCTIYMAM